MSTLKWSNFDMNDKPKFNRPKKHWGPVLPWARSIRKWPLLLWARPREWPILSWARPREWTFSLGHDQWYLSLLDTTNEITSSPLGTANRMTLFLWTWPKKWRYLPWKRPKKWPSSLGHIQWNDPPSLDLAKETTHLSWA